MNEVAMVVNDRVVQKILPCQLDSCNGAKYSPKTSWELPACVEIAEPEDYIRDKPTLFISVNILNLVQNTDTYL